MRRRLGSKIFAGIATHQILVSAGTPLLLILISLVLMLLSSANQIGVNDVRMGINNMVTPVIAIFTKPFHVSVDFVSNVSGMAELRAENTKLEAENIRLREWYQTALMLQSENQSLKNLLNLQIEPHFQYVSTRVIADAGNAFVKSFLVNAGHEQNIQRGQPVISGDGLIGRVVNVGSQVSRILLLTDINSRVPVMIDGSRQRAILSGNNTNFPVLKHLPPDTAVEEGMRIVTSGHGGLFPPGLDIGQVQKSGTGEYFIRLHTDVNRLSHVRILDVTVDPNIRKGQIR